METCARPEASSVTRVTEIATRLFLESQGQDFRTAGKRLEICSSQQRSCFLSDAHRSKENHFVLWHSLPHDQGLSRVDLSLGCPYQLPANHRCRLGALRTPSHAIPGHSEPTERNAYKTFAFVRRHVSARMRRSISLEALRSPHFSFMERRLNDPLRYFRSSLQSSLCHFVPPMIHGLHQFLAKEQVSMVWWNCLRPRHPQVEWQGFVHEDQTFDCLRFGPNRWHGSKWRVLCGFRVGAFVVYIVVVGGLYWFPWPIRCLENLASTFLGPWLL